VQKSQKFHLPSLGQLLYSGTGLATSLSVAAAALAGALMLISLRSDPSGQQASVMLGTFWTSLLVAVLMLPSGGYALLRLLGRPLPAWRLPNRHWLTTIGLVLWPLAVALGAVLSQQDTLALLFLPPLQVVVVGLPIWWLVEIGRARLPHGSPQRGWGLFGVSLTLTPFALILAEVGLIAVGIVVWAVWLSAHPEALNALSDLSSVLSSERIDPEYIRAVLAPYLRQPGVVFAGLAFMAGLVPVVEELLKPLALWFLLPRRLTPAEGFTGGLLCGAGFALIESLGMFGSVSRESWALIVIARFGTGLLHTLTAGLVGWGLASAWSEGRYLRLGLIYLCSVAFHCMWNLLSMANAFGAFLTENDTGWLYGVWTLGQASVVALVVLALILLAALLGGNHFLRSAQAAQADQPLVEKDV